MRRRLSSGAGQIATTATGAACGLPRGVDRGEAAHARAAQSHPPGVLAHQTDHRHGVVERPRSEDALGAAVAAGVVGQGGHALVAAAAGEVEVALLGRAGAVHDHHSQLGLALGQEEGVRDPVPGAQLGRRR